MKEESIFQSSKMNKIKKILFLLLILAILLGINSSNINAQSKVAKGKGITRLTSDIKSILGKKFGAAPSAEVSKILAELAYHSDELICQAWIINCAITIRNLHIKYADSSDPNMHKLIQDLEELLALIELNCQKHVFDNAGESGSGATNGGSDVSGDETTTGRQRDKRYTLPEQICMDRCGNEYWAYRSALDKAYEAKENAEKANNEAEKAEKKSALSNQRISEINAELGSTHKDVTNKTGAERMKAAEKIPKLNDAISFAKEEAERNQRKAEEAKRIAEASEKNAQYKVDEMESARKAYLDCIESCIGDAKSAGIEIDPTHLFKFSSVPKNVKEADGSLYREIGKKSKKEIQKSPVGSQLFLPDVAFSGGKLYGMVIDSDNNPVENTTVITSTLSGVIVQETTDENGTFTSPIPVGFEPVTVTCAGIELVQKLKIINSIPKYIPYKPNEYVQTGSKNNIIGDYSNVEFENNPFSKSEIPSTSVTGELISVPVSRAINSDGSMAITSYKIPENLKPGNYNIYFVDELGEKNKYEMGVFEIVSAEIEREKLIAGEKAEFFYEFNFGQGPEREVGIRINTTGPIKFKREGKIIPLKVNSNGHAKFLDNIRARKSIAKTSVPFTIHLTIVKL